MRTSTPEPASLKQRPVCGGRAVDSVGCPRTTRPTGCVSSTVLHTSHQPGTGLAGVVVHSSLSVVGDAVELSAHDGRGRRYATHIDDPPAELASALSSCGPEGSIGNRALAAVVRRQPQSHQQQAPPVPHD